MGHVQMVQKDSNIGGEKFLKSQFTNRLWYIF